MGKKRSRTKKISKGQRPSMSSSILSAARSIMPGGSDLIKKVEAWREGKNPWITVENPDKQATNRQFIRMKADRYFGGTFKDLKSRFKRPTEEAAN